MPMCCKRNLKSGELADCVCGCGGKTNNFFTPSHDGPFYRDLAVGAKNLDTKSVLWCSLPLCSNNGLFAGKIKAYREKMGCTDTPEIQPLGGEQCRYA